MSATFDTTFDTTFVPCANQGESAKRPSVAELYRAYEGKVYRRVDRLFFVLMAVQWVVGIIFALIVSPRAWSGANASGINAAGQVVGMSYTSTAEIKAFLWSPAVPNGMTGAMFNLGSLGALWNYASGINAGGGDHRILLRFVSRASLESFLPKHERG